MKMIGPAVLLSSCSDDLPFMESDLSDGHSQSHVGLVALDLIVS